MKRKVIFIVDIISVIAIIVGSVILINTFKSSNNKTVNVTFNSFNLYEGFFKQLKTFPEKYDELLTSSFGLSEEEKKSITQHPEDWLAYNIFVSVDNRNNYDILLDKFNNPKQGKDGVFVGEMLDSIQIVSNGAPAVAFTTVLVHNGELSDAECEELVKTKKITLGFSKYTDDFGEIGNEQIKKTRVKF